MAVALGIGAAVASCPGIALADPEGPTTSASDSVDSNSGVSADRNKPHPQPDTEDTSTNPAESDDPDLDDPDSPDDQPVEAPGDEAEETSQELDTEAPADETGHLDRDAGLRGKKPAAGASPRESATASTPDDFEVSDIPAGSGLDDDATDDVIVAEGPSRTGESVTATEASTVLTEQVSLSPAEPRSVNLVHRWFAAALRPLMGTNPAVPSDPPLLLAFLAAARRAATVGQQATPQSTTSAEILWPSDAVVVSGRVGKYLQGIALSPDGRRLYVADMDSGAVRVIDANSGRPLRAISVGKGPYGIAITPDGKRVFVTVNADNVVRVIDTATNRVIGDPIAIPEDPRQIAVSPDGRRIYISHSQNFNREAAITVIDAATLKTVGAPIAVTGTQQFMAVSRDGKRLFVQTYDGDARTSHVAVLDAVTGAVIGQKTPVNASIMAISPDEKRYYAAGERDTVHILDAATGATVGQAIPLLDSPYSMTVSPDGTRLYVWGFGSDWGVVSVIDTTTAAVLGATEIGAWPGEITISADGRRIYTTGTNGNITVIDTAKLEGKNSAPTATVRRQGSPSSSGRVTGSLTAGDSDKDRLSYTGMTTDKGTVTVTSRGSFTYTPTAAARHAAAATTAPASAKTDTVTITVSDGKGGIASVPITVTIRPLNSSPTSARSSVAKPDPVSGAVTGRVSARDRDGDTLTYSVTPLASGSVTFNADGTFTYTPTDAAREKARSTRGTDIERFKVTVDDGHGGAKTVSVSVTIAPQNSAPQTGTTTTETANRVTGVIETIAKGRFTITSGLTTVGRQIRPEA